MIDPRFETRLRGLAHVRVPVARGLEDRVMGAVRASAADPRARWRHGTGDSGRVIAAIAAALVAALLSGVLIGVRLSTESLPTRAVHPSRDAAIIAVRAVVDRDARLVDQKYDAITCTSRAECEGSLVALRVATMKLLTDLDAAAPPAGIEPSALDVGTASKRLIQQLDAAIAMVSLPGSDYAAAANGPEIGALDLAVAGLDCWPMRPVQDDHGWSCS